MAPDAISYLATDSKSSLVQFTSNNHGRKLEEGGQRPICMECSPDVV